MPDADATHQGWSSQDKFSAILETASLNQTELAEYCRRRAIFPEQIATWREACLEANNWL